MGAAASIDFTTETTKPADAGDLTDKDAAVAEVSRLRKLLAENAPKPADASPTEPTVGKCFCGSCTVTVEGPPMYHAICHCESFRLWTGTYAMNMIVYPLDKLKLEGDVISYTRTHKENNPANRKCCANCGSSLYVDHGGKVALTSGSLFTKDQVAPIMGHMCVPEAQYCSMGDTLPKYKAGPPELGYPGDKFPDNDPLSIGNKDAGFLYEGNNFSPEGTVEGTCYCGAVKIKCQGEPMKKILCSCRSCQHWTGGFGNMGCLYPQDKVTIEGETKVFCKSPDSGMPSHRTFCATCGGNVMNAHPKQGLLDICAGTLNAFPFKPDVFLNYCDEERQIVYKDGIPKFKDVPGKFGGSNMLVDEITGTDIGEAPAH
jgi:hypothetical protein